MSIAVAGTSETNIKKVEKPRLPHFFYRVGRDYFTKLLKAELVANLENSKSLAALLAKELS